METNLDEIKQGSINYYTKTIIDNEIVSALADKEGDWKTYYSETKEAQNNSFRLMLLKYDETSCALLTDKANETIPDTKVDNVKSCSTLDQVSLTYFSKLNTTVKNNPDIFNPYDNNSYNIFFENGYRFVNSFNINESQGSQSISTNPSLQKLFGLNGQTQPIRNNPPSNSQSFYWYNQKLVGRLDLTNLTDPGLALFIDNPNGNLSDIITKEGYNFCYFYLSNIQLTYFKEPEIKNIDDNILINITNAPLLEEVRGFYDFANPVPNRVIEHVFINCPKLNFVGLNNFFGKIQYENCGLLESVDAVFTSIVSNLIIKSCDSFITLFAGDQIQFQSENFEDGHIDIQDCSIFERVELKTDGPTSCQFITITSTSLVYNYFGADGLFKKLSQLTNAPQINVSNNSFTEEEIDQILIDINSSSWVGASTLTGFDKSISIGGNNSAPSANVIANIIPSLQSSGWTIS